MATKWSSITISLFFPLLASLYTVTVSFPPECYRNAPTLVFVMDGFSSALCCETSPISHTKESNCHRSRIHTLKIIPEFCVFLNIPFVLD